MGLVNVFGDRPIPKILDFFRLHSYWDYSLKDVSKATGISYRTLQIIIPQLVKKGFLRYTRTEGKAKLYQFNADSEIAKRLNAFALDMDFEIAKMRNKKKVAA